jgi:hypothetical protein
MSVTTNICTLAFAGLALLSPFSAQANDAPKLIPTTDARVIYPDVKANTYFQYLTTGTNHARRVVDCTLGTMRNEMIIVHPIAQSGYAFIQPTPEVSVSQLTLRAQQTIRTNCNSNGLRAEF